jgi:AcrR family transcriptional regulator
VDEKNERHPRADSERNRARILDVAIRLFAERGMDVTLNDIAHEAGLGVGTVYRKFPDKAALIEVLTDQKLAQIQDTIERGLDLPTVGQAFRALMLGAAESRANDRGLFPILFRAGRDSAELDERVATLLHTWDEIIVRARAEGVVRPGFSGADVDLYMLMVGSVADASSAIAPDAWRRCAELLLDGYAPQPGNDDIGELNLEDAARRAIFLGRPPESSP